MRSAINDIIFYGGVPLKRKQVIQLMTEQGFDWKCIQFFAFFPPPAKEEELAAWKTVSYEQRLNLVKEYSE